MSYRSELAIRAAADQEAATGRLIQSAIDAAITETLADLRDRLAAHEAVVGHNQERAYLNHDTLRRAYLNHDTLREAEYMGERRGLRLALSYVDEALRTARTETPS